MLTYVLKNRRNGNHVDHVLWLVFKKTGLAIISKNELFSENNGILFFVLHIFIVFRSENESVSNQTQVSHADHNFDFFCSLCYWQPNGA